MSLCQQEIDDAREMVRRGGFDPGDFDFACGTTASGGPGGGAIATEIVVTRTTTRKQRTYAGGLASDWLRHFEAELHAKLFD
jgi:hypothetical protein